MIRFPNELVMRSCSDMVSVLLGLCYSGDCSIGVILTVSSQEGIDKVDSLIVCKNRANGEMVHQNYPVDSMNESIMQGLETDNGSRSKCISLEMESNSIVRYGILVGKCNGSEVLISSDAVALEFIFQDIPDEELPRCYTFSFTREEV